MFCKNCGTQNGDNQKFCTACGASLTPDELRCSSCGAKLAPGAAFCEECGCKVGGQTQEAGNSSSGFSIDSSKPTPTGRILCQPKQYSMYNGEPTLGFAKGSGPLTVYDDRLEFKKTLGNSAGGAFGLIGMAVAKNKANKDPLIIIPVNQIAELRVGSYGGVYKTLVVVEKNHTVTSFAPMMPGSNAPQEIVNALKPYIG